MASSLLPELSAVIKRSHDRSRMYGIDPHLDGAPETSRLSDEELAQRIEKQHVFYSLAKEQLDTLYGLLRGTGFCMALADMDGYVLYVIGDSDLVEHFKRRRCLPGYRWREQEMGTCAIGLTLVEGIPVYLPGNLMFSAQAKTISNAGSPCFSPSGNSILGVISLSGPSTMMHVHTLGLVRQAAETITSHLRERQHLRELAIHNRYSAALMESNSQGMIAVDRQGRIMQTNGKARSLLTLPAEHEGKFFSEYVGKDEDISRWVDYGKGFRSRELVINDTSHYVSFDPVRMENDEIVGGLFTVTEKKELMQMAVEVTGLHPHFTFSSILGNSQELKDTMHIAKIASKSSAPVLITGETGTGKELFAQAIHNNSERSRCPFVAINCGAIPKELLESELFGYDEGAFTGAKKGGRPGKLELADSGTLFLDEIGDMPFDMQVKLLRVLQSGELQRVGSLRIIPVDIRVIAATNKNIGDLVDEHHFRSDLYYRISTFHLSIPPLRERGEDVLLLTDYFIKRHAAQLGRDLPPLGIPASTMLKEYAWPGNIRQLEGAVERAIYLAEGKTLCPEHFGLDHEPPLAHLTLPKERNEPPLSLAAREKEAIAQALEYCQNNIQQTSKILGISRPTLYRKMEVYELAPPTQKSPV